MSDPWRPSDAELQRYFTLKVSFADYRHDGLIEQLTFILWGVEKVLSLFDPTFTNGDPPLPVTTVLSQREQDKIAQQSLSPSLPAS